jgi:hypothetical protein
MDGVLLHRVCFILQYKTLCSVNISKNYYKVLRPLCQLDPRWAEHSSHYHNRIHVACRSAY